MVPAPLVGVHWRQRQEPPEVETGGIASARMNGSVRTSRRWSRSRPPSGLIQLEKVTEVERIEALQATNDVVLHHSVHARSGCTPVSRDNCMERRTPAAHGSNCEPSPNTIL